jgi:hypothetical protein
MNWLPIEAAPRDGSLVILLWEDDYVCGGYYLDGDWHAISLAQHGCGCCSESDPPPLYWMPQPATPKPEEGE